MQVRRNLNIDAVFWREKSRVFYARAGKAISERTGSRFYASDFSRQITSDRVNWSISIRLFLCRSVEIVELWMETIHTNRVAVTKQLHENRQSQLCYLESVIKEKHEQCLNQTPLNLGHSTRDVDEKVKLITCFHDSWIYDFFSLNFLSFCFSSS